LGIDPKALVALHNGEVKAYQLPLILSNLVKGEVAYTLERHIRVLRKRGIPITDQATEELILHLANVKHDTKGRTAWQKAMLEQLEQHIAFRASRGVAEWMLYSEVSAWMIEHGYKGSGAEVDLIVKRHLHSASNTVAINASDYSSLTITNTTIPNF
jgi:hypothetical protein